jgi:hypothetical protein
MRTNVVMENEMMNRALAHFVLVYHFRGRWRWTLLKLKYRERMDEPTPKERVARWFNISMGWGNHRSPDPRGFKADEFRTLEMAGCDAAAWSRFGNTGDD